MARRLFRRAGSSSWGSSPRRPRWRGSWASGTRTSHPRPSSGSPTGRLRSPARPGA
uniref:Uncharacterized protein n=1 Tax=Arundo donax TaxID=35708 RepID=A0A0A9B1G2_ARUDO